MVALILLLRLGCYGYYHSNVMSNPVEAFRSLFRPYQCEALPSVEFTDLSYFVDWHWSF